VKGRYPIISKLGDDAFDWILEQRAATRRGQ